MSYHAWLLSAGAPITGAGRPPTAPPASQSKHASLALQQHAKQLSNGRGEVPRTATPPPRSKPQQAQQAQHGAGGKGTTAQRTATPPPRTASPSLLEADSSLDAEMDAAVVRKAKQPKQTAVPARLSPLGARPAQLTCAIIVKRPLNVPNHITTFDLRQRLCKLLCKLLRESTHLLYATHTMSPC